jgi:hypothetical protein
VERSRAPGIVSLVLALGAVAVGGVAVFRASPPCAAAYAAIVAAAAVIVLKVYCAKCPAAEHCGHVLPGPAARLLGRRPSGPYSKAELVATGIALVAMIGPPQIWLWREPVLEAAFWVPLIAAIILIRRRVCPGCDNAFCPARLTTPPPRSAPAP